VSSEAFVACRSAADISIKFDRLDPNKAVPTCQAALTEMPDDPWLMAYFARALRKVGRHDEANTLLRRSANAGNALGQVLLGGAYDFGFGVPRNDTEAFKWYRLAAEQGHARAQNNLGEMYANGRGIARDDSEAVKWFQLAADQGESAAQNNL